MDGEKWDDRFAFQLDHSVLRLGFKCEEGVRGGEKNLELVSIAWEKGDAA